MKQLLFTLSVLIALAATAIVAGALRRESRSTALAAGSVSVRFVPTTTTMIIGPTPAPTIDIDVANIPSPPGLGGYTVGLSWNPAVATLNSLTDAGVFAGGQNVVICATPTITAGAAHASCATLPFAGTPGPGVAVELTPVPLLHASFAPVGAGTSPLGLTAVIGLTPYVTTLKDPNGTPIASTQTGGALVVQGAPVTLGGVDNDSQATGRNIPGRDASVNRPVEAVVDHDWRARGSGSRRCRLVLVSPPDASRLHVAPMILLRGVVRRMPAGFTDSRVFPQTWHHVVRLHPLPPRSR